MLPHPTAGLWMASIVLSEGGYWLALLASPLVVDPRAWRRSEDGRLLEAGVPHALVRLPWATHACDYLFRGPCGQVSTFAVEWFLDAVLR